MSLPVSILAHDLGKKYRKNWLFQHVDLDLRYGQTWAILGRNGSGKSTLLKILGGAVLPSVGRIEWLLDDKALELKDYHRFFSLSAPYLELVNEFTLTEMLDFHFSLKPMIEGFSREEVIRNAGLYSSADVKVKYFSSGMLQRLKLVTCLYSDVPVLLLDEPCTNMDEEGIAWYRSVINEIKLNRLIIVASNQKHEYEFCDYSIEIDNLKPVQSK